MIPLFYSLPKQVTLCLKNLRSQRERERERVHMAEEEEKNLTSTLSWPGFKPTTSVSLVKFTIHLTIAPCLAEELKRVLFDLTSQDFSPIFFVLITCFNAEVFVGSGAELLSC